MAQSARSKVTDMNPLPYSEFGCLRLNDFLIGEMAVDRLADWEYLNRRWVGERVGHFTTFLRLESDPEVLSALTLDLSAQPQKVWNSILDKVGVPLRGGMSESTVQQTAGSHGKRLPKVGHRTTLEFVIGSDERFCLRCTFDRTHGLTYIAMLRADIADR
jgi:hypothetical protein